ncbi:hypothetical protein DAD186_02640 [Dermabacter vaginalis]|uniref:Uncharacterized protein n=1 Tax=Dermabacter vaginalis TaxID=1630135 RepID=A0A1B0ZFW8_9MICO|nr:hypothetical protein [Dermabacter vaginalis]ANP26823.1 hypothetical protein DAD186_02640 [Dermabacter vaginalis]
MDENAFTVRYDEGGLASAASPREARARRYLQALTALCRRHLGTLIALLIAGILADIFLKKTFGIHIFFISFVISGTVFALLGYAFYRRGRVLYEQVFLDHRKNPPAAPPAATGSDALEWAYSIDGVGLWLGEDFLGLVPDADHYETYPWSEVRLEETALTRIGKKDLIVHLPHRHLRYSGDKLGLSAAEIVARAQSLRA